MSRFEWDVYHGDHPICMKCITLTAVIIISIVILIWLITIL